MTPEFIEANQEALDEAEFYEIINPSRHTQPLRHVGEGLESIGNGIAWLGFWIAVAAIATAVILKGWTP